VVSFPQTDPRYPIPQRTVAVVPAIWMQEDVTHGKAAGKPRQPGMFLGMNRSILQEYRARFR